MCGNYKADVIVGGGAVPAKIRPAGSSVYQTDEKAAGCRSERHRDHIATAVNYRIIQRLLLYSKALTNR